ncbi:hypothetical protein JCM14036_12350 [Desulfotomaculum defluvii]
MDRRVLVVTSCTGEKCYKPENELILDDFKDQVRLKVREDELTDFQTTAGELYTGKQHVSLMKGVQEYRNQGGQIDVNILSAGYGLLNEEDSIVPYEVTFSTMNSLELKEWSKCLNVTADLQKKIKDYDVVFMLLGDKYLQAVNWLKLETRKDQKLVFFAGQSGKQKILIKPNYHLIAVTEQEAKVFHSGLVEIKGTLMAMLLRYIQHDFSLWDSIYQKPGLIREYILEIHKNSQQWGQGKVNIAIFGQEVQLTIGDESAKLYDRLLAHYTIDIAEHEIAINYGQDFQYYMPENDDRVDPDYDFLEDKPNRKGDPLDHDVYAHELHDIPKYNGLLISKVNIDGASQKKKEKIQQLGIRKFLRLPEDYPIMGDCGAFSYINDYEPPYITEQVLEYYHSMGFDYGVSVDHLIVGKYMKDEVERNRRYQLTLDNARDFIEKYHQYKDQHGYTFTPIGIAQGWDPISFREAVKELVKMGYRYIALGGLAMEKSVNIFHILKEIAPVIPDANFRMHLFGVVRDNMEYMRVFHKLGVTSFDSASPLRRAWLGSEHNYYAPDRHYAAIRIPEATAKSPRVKKQIKKYLESLYTFELFGQYIKSLKTFAFEQFRETYCSELTCIRELEEKCLEQCEKCPEEGCECVRQGLMMCRRDQQYLEDDDNIEAAEQDATPQPIYNCGYKCQGLEYLENCESYFQQHLQRFNQEVGLDLTTWMRETFQLEAFDGFGTVLKVQHLLHDDYPARVEKLVEFIHKQLKDYDAKKVEMKTAVDQVVQYLKKVDLVNTGERTYAGAFEMLDMFKELEKRSLAVLRDYDLGRVDLETTLATILEYDEKLGEDREKHSFYYQELLEDQPWKNCDCNICKKCGVEVVIFRGNNRNRRRGFHNTHVFFEQIGKLKEEIRDEIDNQKFTLLEVTNKQEKQKENIAFSI